MPHQFKIFAPIDKKEESLSLIRAGVDEFFCGVMFGNDNFSSIRKAARSRPEIEKFNFRDFDELRKAVAIIKKHGKKIYLAINQPNMDIHQKKIIDKNIERIKDVGVDGVILTDMELMEKFRKSGLKIIASSFLKTQNEETIKLLKKMGAKRVIFDRQISLNDLAAVRRFPGMEFEVFIMAAACRSMPGYCANLAIFADDNLWESGAVNRHICCGNFLFINEKSANSLINKEDEELVARRLRIQDDLFNGIPACGACSLYQFKKYGINYFKIVGRGFQTDLKIKSVKLIRTALDVLEAGCSKEKFYNETQNLFVEIFGLPCGRRYCYYPHFFD